MEILDQNCEILARNNSCKISTTYSIGKEVTKERVEFDEIVEHMVGLKNQKECQKAVEMMISAAKIFLPVTLKLFAGKSKIPYSEIEMLQQG